MERHLQRLKWKNVRDLVPARIDTVIFCVGTIEAHGATALGTDNFIPESIADHLAGKINALIAPTLNYGITKSLYGYPGSITIKPRNFQPFVSDILKSFHDIGFSKIIIMNGHGGNNLFLKEAAQEFFYSFRKKIAIVHWWELCAELVREFYGEAGGHAALDETALIQAIDENLVDKSQYDDHMTYLIRPGSDIYPIPGSILLYTKDQGYPDFDIQKAAQFQKKVFEQIEEFVKLVLARWEKI